MARRSNTEAATARGNIWAGRSAALSLVLVLVTLAVYWPVLHADFVNYDDDKYVTANAHVLAGLSWPNLLWAFGTAHANFWHPLTWLSHMTDCELYGIRPAGHHFTSLALHVFNTLLLFGLLRRMTGASWRSALVAALFAVHPLHVESVAWVAERKDVLSTFFGLLTLWAYVEYAKGAGDRSQESGDRSSKAEDRRPKEGRKTKAEGRNPHGEVSHSAFWYLLALLLFVLSLMSKPMLITLPFLLLLLDFWPLQRLRLSRLKAQRSTLLEKVPFLGLAAVFGMLAVWAQQHGGSLMSLEHLPLSSRLANVLVSYARYLGKTLWPANLAVPYPMVPGWPMWQVAGAGLLVLACSLAAVAFAQRRPSLLTGWFWFVGTLVPVIGLVQVGNYSLADRFTYLPSVGLFVAAAWGLHALTLRWPRHQPTLGLAAVCVVVACAWRTAVQVHYWQNSETLFTHATQVTRDNYIAYNNLGTALNHSGQSEAAIDCFTQALRIKPDHPEAHINLALALSDQKKYGEAIAHYEAALHVAPADAQAHNNLANLLDQLGRSAEALPHYLAALQAEPDSPEAEYNLAGSLAGQGRLEEAAAHYERALRLAPQNASAHYNLAALLARQGRLPEAKEHYLAALRLNPAHASAHNNLGNLLVRLGEPQEAAAHFIAALAIEPDFAEAHYSLARVLIGQGRFEAARPHLREARQLRPDWAPALDELARSLDSAGSSNRSAGASP